MSEADVAEALLALVEASLARDVVLDELASWVDDAVELPGGGPGGGGGGPLASRLSLPDALPDALPNALSDALLESVLSKLARSVPISLADTLEPEVLLAVLADAAAFVVSELSLDDADDWSFNRKDWRSLASFAAAVSEADDVSVADWLLELLASEGGGPGGGPGGGAAACDVSEVDELWSVLLDWDDCRSFHSCHCDVPLLPLTDDRDIVCS